MEVTDLVSLDSTGYHFSDYPAFNQYLIDKYQAIYGADTYLAPDSQDGQWLAVVAKMAYDLAAIGNSTNNSFSPLTAQGVGLARLVKINGLKKLLPSFSTVTLSVVGTAGTIIANGIAKDILDQQWLLPVTVTIPDEGTIDVVATAAVVGAITADINTVTTIFTPTQGWQNVTNAAAATPGAAVESDANLRIRQSVSTSDPSLTVFEGTIGGVENLPGVTKVQGYENDTETTDANSIPPHSICVVVAGGDSVDIAQEIQIHKTPGTGTYGDTSETVFDTHGMPLLIKFQRAVTATIHVAIDISVNEGWSNDYEALIKQAVADVINAGGIGKSILYTKLFAPAYLTGTPASATFDIASLEIAKNMDMPAAANIDLDFDENPVCDPTTDVVVNPS